MDTNCQHRFISIDDHEFCEVCLNAMPEKQMKHVVQFSGGVGSWACAKRVAARHGTANMVLLFADVKDEDEDLYRFIGEAAADIGVPLTVISDGRTPREVMRDERFIGNSRVDSCSKILKRALLDRWHRVNCDPAATVIYIGIDFSEEHRFVRYAKRVAPWVSEAPLCQAPYMDKEQIQAWLQACGIAPPRLYAMGFPHNNCGGACIKAGQAQWALLLEKKPDLYLSWEEWEEEMRVDVGDHSILRDRTGGKSRPLTLRNFRLKVETQQTFDRNEWGGCGCAIE